MYGGGAGARCLSSKVEGSAVELGVVILGLGRRGFEVSRARVVSWGLGRYGSSRSIWVVVAWGLGRRGSSCYCGLSRGVWSSFVARELRSERFGSSLLPATHNLSELYLIRFLFYASLCIFFGWESKTAFQFTYTLEFYI